MQEWTAFAGSGHPTPGFGAPVAITAALDDRLPGVEATVQAVRQAARLAGRNVRIVLGGRLGSRPGIAGTLGLDWAGGTLSSVEVSLAGFRAELEAERRR